ncbi:hypothetical protein [Paenibacillus periandrae]|uniref:hypothetical protein n=1 Tax=Paenibacillus periandrae TaxID=1761741 RepID=UPI001F0960CB|nr:hypothetical protein [Paenibacillus periandrae]
MVKLETGSTSNRVVKIHENAFGVISVEIHARNGKEQLISPEWLEWRNDCVHFAKLRNFLLDRSGLPGPRANLGLAKSFANSFVKQPPSEAMWKLLLEWANLSAAEAPTNNSGEFLPFCSVLALGAYYLQAAGERKLEIVAVLKETMSDSRWRIRESAASALQSIGEQSFQQLQIWFEEWLEDANCLERRAFVAALAHPPLLKDRNHVHFCLSIAERILDDFADRKPAATDEEARILSTGLEYAISLFVEKEPERGFALLKKYAVSNDKRMKKIIKSNLSKSRLCKKYAPQVEEVSALL